MNLDINVTSIFAASMVGAIVLIRYLYFLFANKKRLPNQLFKGAYLILFAFNFVLMTSSIAVTLLFSNNFYYNGFFFSWALIVLVSISLYVVLWIIFFMHGYDARFQFKKVVLPCPMTILEIITLLSTAIFSYNWILLGIAVTYAFTSYLWNYKGYLLTKPKIPDYIPIRENDEP